MTLKRRGKKSWRKKNRKLKLRYGISARQNIFKFLLNIF